MRLNQHSYGFTVWVSARETEEWARKWPCSTLRGKRFVAEFDSTGLCDLSVEGRRASDDLSAAELSACVADMVAEKLDKDNPAWYVAVGQFKEDN